MRTWITPVSLLANITVTMMVLGLLRQDRCDASPLSHCWPTPMMVLGLLDRCDGYLDHMSHCWPTSQSP